MSLAGHSWQNSQTPPATDRLAGAAWKDSESMWLRVCFLLLLLCLPESLAQGPGSSLRGVIRGSQGQPLAGAEVTVRQSDQETGFRQTTNSDSNGEYHFRLLPRGLYTLRVAMAGYGDVEKSGIELPVGARLIQDVVLSSDSALQKPEAVSSTSVFTILEPEPIEDFDPSRSVLVEESKLLHLPMANRNIYSLFLLQPGVTSQGAISTRGLSFSVHGQRVSGSNYLLDEVDNNNIVLTGPVTATSAEAIQEFRMVNSNFTAENGRATAFVAQVVTRRGTNRLHGSIFEYFSHDKLNANTFQNNSNRMQRSPFRQNQFGLSVAGPAAKNKTFFSGALELSRLRYRTMSSLRLPTAFFIENLPTDSQARWLLTEVPPLPVAAVAGNPNIGTTQYQVPNRIDTLLATGRLDHHFDNTRDRLILRYTLASTDQVVGTGGSPGYPGLQPTDEFQAHNSLFGWTHSFSAGQVSDFRVGWSRERIALPRPRPDLPTLQSSDVLLPGSRRRIDLHENNNVVQMYLFTSLRDL